MRQDSFILKGNICYSKTIGHLSITDHGYLICHNGICRGVYPVLPEKYQNLPIIDYHDMLIIPGMTDLHIHAPQYPFRGLGMDLELLDWLNTHTFPEESRYVDLEYAIKAYKLFTDNLKKSASTRAVVFGTIHTPATSFLMEQLDTTGLKTYVGKVNMDVNCPDNLREKDAQTALDNTDKWLQKTIGKYQNTSPIITPRFAPACSESLLEGLGKLLKKYQLPVQSHLSENLSEIEWVKKLFPWSSCYGDVYDHYELFGTVSKTVMAHCVYSTDEETELLKENGVSIAHCPQSNINLSSGIAPIRSYLDAGIPVGLGTDMAGGANLSMFRCMADAVGVSKLYWRLVDQEKKPLTIEEVFYLATKGGGSFFGNTGSFEDGYEMDALILDDTGISSTRTLNTKERLERYIYLADEGGKLAGKYTAGTEILLSE